MTTPTGTTEVPGKLLDRVRKLLAKAEDDACTPEEALALTEKAAELMARWGIDRALLEASGPQADVRGSRMIIVGNPWGRVKSHLLCGLAREMRCQAILLTGGNPVPGGGVKVHLFGYVSDLDRVDFMYTNLMLQMFSLLRRQVPPASSSSKAWNRSWLLGYATAAIGKVRAAEGAATQSSADAGETASNGQSTALVLADRSLAVKADVKAAYPRTRTARTTYSGSGYADGYRHGQNADLGGGRVGRGTQGTIAR
jgi:hypothetical protein